MASLVAGRIIPYRPVEALQDAGLSKAVLIQLAKADAFLSLGLIRRDALW
jgi:DNA polymerase III alpha subunit